MQDTVTGAPSTVTQMHTNCIQLCDVLMTNIMCTMFDQAGTDVDPAGNGGMGVDSRGVERYT
eukprot:CAMPEP_0194445086 /NCGR_PEP_ID=MMETSP0176-20130528/127658_1 /TAXON_ID=216777 /ORGANISM="Proboscia alata, Strain PI-D3" /LENGTH=61 /DNA_ID=CAMNT_0039271585 /DNA_START=803 /DNA_END=985 /DNA_ORIENTATION=-